MGFLRERTSKKFEYQPRYYKGEGNPYEIGHKFDEYRTTVGGTKGIKEKFQSAFKESENAKNRGFNKVIIIIIAVLVFIFLYVIDFDLSIFKNPF